MGDGDPTVFDGNRTPRVAGHAPKNRMLVDVTRADGRQSRMSDTNSQIDSLIRSFVTELNAMIRSAALDAVGTALGGQPVAKRGPGRPKKSSSAPTTQGTVARRSGTGGKRPPAELARTVENLLKHISAHPGERIEEIGKHLGLTTKDLALPAQKLLAAKKITRKGVKRSTTYYPAK